MLPHPESSHCGNHRGGGESSRSPSTAHVGAASTVNEQSGLTPAEKQILWLIADGLVLKEVADRMEITVETVRSHTKHIYEKLSVHTQGAAVAKALREGSDFSICQF